MKESGKQTKKKNWMFYKHVETTLELKKVGQCNMNSFVLTKQHFNKMKKNRNLLSREKLWYNEFLSHQTSKEGLSLYINNSREVK